MGFLHHECFYEGLLPFDEESDTVFMYIYVYTRVFLLPIHQGAVWVPLLGTACVAASTQEADLSSAPPHPPWEQGTLSQLIHCLEKGWSLMRMLVCCIPHRQLTSHLPFTAQCCMENQHLDTPGSVPSTTEGTSWVSVGVQVAASSR